jgi:GTP-binding protein EngB required for normal cell division
MNTDELLDALISKFPPASVYAEDPNAVKIAIVGRPNVGKSSLVNACWPGTGHRQRHSRHYSGRHRYPFRFNGKDIF